MDTRSRIEQLLTKQTPLSSGYISQVLGTPLSEVMSILSCNKKLFAYDPNTHSWSLKDKKKEEPEAPEGTLVPCRHCVTSTDMSERITLVRNYVKAHQGRTDVDIANATHLKSWEVSGVVLSVKGFRTDRTVTPHAIFFEEENPPVNKDHPVACSLPRPITVSVTPPTVGHVVSLNPECKARLDKLAEYEKFEARLAALEAAVQTPVNIANLEVNQVKSHNSMQLVVARMNDIERRLDKTKADHGMRFNSIEDAIKDMNRDLRRDRADITKLEEATTMPSKNPINNSLDNLYRLYNQYTIRINDVVSAADAIALRVRNTEEDVSCSRDTIHDLKLAVTKLQKDTSLTPINKKAVVDFAKRQLDALLADA